MVNTYRKGEHVTLGSHFSSSEFDCNCSSCTATIVDPELIEKLEALRKLLGAPLSINSGYRCAAKQAELRAAGYETAIGVSQHELARAADIMRADTPTSGVKLEQLARQAGFKAVGVGNYWVHVDLRDDKDRRWTYCD